MKFKTKNSISGAEIKEVRNISKFWQKNELKILTDIKQITGGFISTEKIICRIDNSTTHGSYGSRTIFLGTKGGIDKEDILMVISHELFHIYYWKKIKEMKLTTSSPGNESKEEWKLAEVAAFLLINEPSLKNNWPNANVYLYPEIKDIYKKVKNFWKKGNIEYFLVNSYKKIRK